MLKHQGTGIITALCLSRLSPRPRLRERLSPLSTLKSHLAALWTFLVSSLALNTLSEYKIVIDKGPTTLCVRLAENDDNIESDRERGWSLESRGGVSPGRDREN